MEYTTQDLVSFLKTLHNAEEEKDDITNVKYIIYARKSTESSERQVRSLADQVTECKSVASSKNFQLASATPIMESESAKEPDIRPKFRQMINDIKNGKYGGIIAWHPDRLARNMKEAGEIIDLIDKGIIKDLQFVSFTFQNNTAGKMLLGITFVLSKQYSDQLSDNVLRGIRRSIEEGKYLSKAKHGYYKDINQYLRPDGDNYTLIKEAWKMRLDGKMQEEIADYLNSHKYSKPTDATGEHHNPFVFSHKRISELFKDSTYCGVLVHGEKEKKIVDLTEVYDFVPMITVDEFMRINKIANLETFFKQRFKAERAGAIKADLLRGKVICGYCNNPMTSGLTTKISGKKGLTHYYNYRCDRRGCKAPTKAVRAHVVVDYGIDYLRKHKFDSREVYEHYVDEMRRVIASQEEVLEAERRSLTSAKVDTDDKIVKIKDLLLQETDIQVKNVFKVDLKKEQANVATLTKDIEKVKEEKAKHKQAIMSYEQFLELFNDLPNIISKTKKLAEKDFLLGKIFLNFTVKNKKVLSCQLNQPFDKFKKREKTEKILPSADERT